MSSVFTLSRDPTVDPDCPGCGRTWDEGTTLGGDHVGYLEGGPTVRWWTLYPCGCQVQLSLSSFTRREVP